MKPTKLEEQLFALEELVKRLMNIRIAHSSPQEAHQIKNLWTNYLEVCQGIELDYKT